MFRHLKPEEFINAAESADGAAAALPKARKAHLDSCAVCSAQLRSIRAAQNELAMENTDIPEPDWHEFRNSVRLELLSRSVQRASTVRRWTGWAIRPAMAWGLSFALLVMVSVGGFLWHVRQDMTKSASNRVQDFPTDTSDVHELSAWTGTGVFQELSTMEDSQMERLQLLIKSAQNGAMNRQ